MQKVNQRSMKRDSDQLFCDFRTGIPPAVVLFTSRKKGWVAVMTSTEGSMARFLRMGSLGHKGDVLPLPLT